MNSNIFFSFSRLYLLLRNDILLNHKKYLLTIAGAFILGFVIIYMQMPDRMYSDNNYKFDATRYTTTFIMCLLGLGAFVGSSFSELSNKVKISNFLLVPASTFEKFLSQFIIRIIAATSIFIVAFWIDSQLARIVVLSHIKDMNGELIGPDKYDLIEKFNYSMLLIKSKYPVVEYWKLYEGIGEIMTFTSIGLFIFSIKIFYRKLGLIKSLISLVAVIYLLVSLMVGISHLFYPETVGFKTADIYYTVSDGYTNSDIFRFSIVYLAPLFLLPLGYYKLKEKQL
jgi:hypothetical protein